MTPPDSRAPAYPETLVDLLFERSPAGLCLVAPDGTVARANAAWLHATGYRADEVVGADILELFPESRHIARELHARARAGASVEVPRHRQHVNGRDAWWEGRIDPVAMAGGTGLLISAVERARTDEQLRRSYETFYGLIQNDPFGVYVVDEDFRLRVVSLGAQKAFAHVRPLLGRDFAEVLRMVWTEPFATAAIERFRRTLATGEGYASPSTVERRADSLELEAYDWRIERIVLPDGRYGVVCYFYDLSERNRWLAALHESEERLRALVKASSDVVYRMSADWGELLELDGRGVLADTTLPTRHWLETYVAPEDQALVVAAVDAAIRSRAVFELEHRVRRADGTLGWALSRAVPLLDRDGNIVEWFGAAGDITARKEAEAARQEALERHARQVRLFEGIASTTPDFVYLFDREGRFQYANRRLLEVWGMVLPDVLGKTCRELGYEQWHHDMHMREIAQVIATRRPIKGEVPFTAPLTGTFGVYEYIFAPVLGADGEVELVAGTTRDITDRKRAEQALRDADRRKDEFLATLAHELRNPLAPVRNAIEILTVPDLGATERRAAQDIIARQINHMVRLIDDLLEVSRITRGKLELRRERVTLASVLEQALETSQPHIDHDVAVVLPTETIHLYADPVRLAQVFSNLINNACKYTPRGGRISVAVAREGAEAVVAVSDTGIGIAREHLPRVFEMFSQATPALDRAGGGLGIGLALVRGLTEMHGGAVSAASPGAGLGSTFTVRLPTLDAQPMPLAGGEAAGSDDGAGAVTRRRILLVEDHVDAAHTLAMLLRLDGNEVAIVHDGREALETAQDFAPDVVLLDIGLPGLNGYEVCRGLRKQAWCATLHIIALTGWGQEEDRRRAKEAGFDGHLVKPVEPAQIRALLASLQSGARRRGSCG